MRRPRLLLLDEPTTGLDPGGMRDMRMLIRRLAGEGITVLLSSHQLTEVEEVCNRVAIIRSGQIVFEGSLDELGRTATTTYRLRTSEAELALSVCKAQPGVSEVRTFGDRDEITFIADEDAVAELSVALVEAGVSLRALIPSRPSLEELFLRITEGDSVGPGSAPKLESRVLDIA